MTHGERIKYVKYSQLEDNSSFFSGPFDTGINVGWGRISFARYGDNFYMMHTLANKNIFCIRKSMDGESWSNCEEITSDVNEKYVHIW